MPQSPCVQTISHSVFILSGRDSRPWPLYKFWWCHYVILWMAEEPQSRLVWTLTLLKITANQTNIYLNLHRNHWNEGLDMLGSNFCTPLWSTSEAISGASEKDTAHSCLDYSVQSCATAIMKAAMKSTLALDLRTVAYVHSIQKIFTTHNEGGLSFQILVYQSIMLWIHALPNLAEFEIHFYICNLFSLFLMLLRASQLLSFHIFLISYNNKFENTTGTWKWLRLLLTSSLLS